MLASPPAIYYLPFTIYRRESRNLQNVDSDPLERLELAKEALKANPNDWELLDAKLDALINLRRFRDALEVTTRMVELWPEGAGAHYNHGFILRFLDRTREAEVALLMALEIKPM